MQLMMHLQIAYDHLMAYNIRAKTPTTPKVQEWFFFVVAPNGNHHKRITWYLVSMLSITFMSL